MIGRFDSNSIETFACSERLRPTPGRSAMTSIPCDCRCLPGPTPDSISRCGELYVPPERITSRRARTVRRSPPCSYSTPTARRCSKITRCASAPVRKARFGRLSAGRRYAVDELTRRPRGSMVTSPRAKPSATSALEVIAVAEARARRRGHRAAHARDAWCRSAAHGSGPEAP